MNMNDPEKVKKMYVNKDTLSTRVNIHKYSTNKYGWNNWIFDKYKLDENINILDIGCGTSDIWIGKEKELPEKINIILSDISPLLIEKAKEKLKENTKFIFQVLDIQNIPFEDKKFDIIIANHMLYHVPNISKALAEVKRVLKNDGTFYATTIGKNHMREIMEIYKKYEQKVKFSYSNELSFLLDSGKDILSRYFTKIKQKRYSDTLEVADINSIMNYIVSYNEVPKEILDEIQQIIENEIKEKGVFKIEKDSGIYICNV